MARGGAPDRSGEGSRRVTPRATPAAPARRVRPRDVIVVALLVAGLLAGTLLVIFGGDTSTDPTTTDPAEAGAQGGTLPLDDLSLEAVEGWSGLRVPDGAEGFLTARVGEGQLDVTFTMSPEDEASFIEGSGLPEPEPGQRKILHTSPLWKLNPGAEDAEPPEPPEPQEEAGGTDGAGPTTTAPPVTSLEIRGAADRHGDVVRAVELVEEEPGTIRARIVLTAA